MLTAVWVAVVAAAAAFVIGVGVAVYVMLKAARLMTESSAAQASLREREDLLIDRASAAVDRAGEQTTKAQTITATMDEVTASMADVTASLTELHGRMTALTPAAPTGPDRASGVLTWSAALVYGLSRALGLRWSARLLPRSQHPARDRRRGPGPLEAAAPSARPLPVTGQRRAALTGRRGGVSR